MIRVDEMVRLVEAIFGGMAELERGSLVTERPEDGLMRHEAERHVDPRGFQLASISAFRKSLQRLISSGQRLVLRRNALHRVDDSSCR